MSKITLLALIAIVVGVAGGVIEVKFHSDKLASLPATLTRIVQEGSLLERGRTLALRLKREGEFWLIRDDAQRLEIATGYVESDAKRLNDLLTQDQSVKKITPSAELLMDSIERVEEVTATTSADNLAAWQAEGKAAFTTAAQTVQRLRETHEGYKAIEQQFAALIAKLTTQIGAIKSDEPAAEVAGAKDEDSPTPAPTIPAIQLNF